jgi:hypothetical protein
MRRLVLLACCLLFPTAAALADGIGPQRKMTEPEAASLKLLQAILRSSLPAAPQDYKLDFIWVSDLDEGMMPQEMPAGEAMHMLFRANYVWQDPSTEQQDQQAMIQRTKGTPEQQARMDALNAREAELTQARDRSRNPEEKARLRAQRKAVNAQIDSLQQEIMDGLQKWLASGGPAKDMEAKEKAKPAREIVVEFTANGDAFIPEAATAFTIEGIPLAFESDEGSGEYGKHKIQFLLGGPFQKDAKISGSWRYRPPSKAAVATKAVSLAVCISGQADKPDEVRKLCRQIDSSKLKAMFP